MIVSTRWFFYIFLTFTIVRAKLKNNGVLPKDLFFAGATAAFQVEGAWKEDGKGESMWDRYTHRIPSTIRDNDTADVACDNYHRYKEDVKLAAEIGLKMYRFSISWPRILPNGYADNINQKGIDHYKDLVKEILKYNMTPAATIYHWDLPQRLYEDGIHWTNESLVEHMVNYARILIKNLPDVGVWFTINEPKQICHGGYGGGNLAPGINSSGLGEYECARVIHLCNAAVYKMKTKEFPESKAKMSMNIDCEWIEALTNSAADEEAAERQRQFECGLYFNPICNGDWPEIVKERINYRSKLANLSQSRLPAFSEQEKKAIKGSYDFLSLNHYYTTLAREAAEAPANETSYDNDRGVVDSFDPRWIVESNGIFVSVPFGVYKILSWLRKNYGYQKILITEIGMSDNGTYIDDTDRIAFYNDYFCYILEAIHEGIDVFGITFWSLMDNFEWSLGYSAHFGLYHIDFSDPTLTRTPKSSAKWAKNLIQHRKLSCAAPSKKWIGPVKLPAYPKHRSPPKKEVSHNKHRDHDSREKHDRKHC